MESSRRRFLIGAGGLALAQTLPALAVTDANRSGTRLILLGTKGGPRVAAAGRRNPSTLLLIDNTPYVVDCGYGTSLQLLAAGVPLDKVRYIFITHHHSDHNLDYGPLFYNSWITGQPMRIDAYGPAGLEAMTQSFIDYMRFDIETRVQDEGRPDLRGFVSAHDFDKPGVVLRTDKVTVSSALVRHPSIKQAYAYRFDAGDRSIVISGDTAYAPELAEFAKGADVLVHEVMYLPGIEGLLQRLPNASRFRKHLLESHALPEDIGRIAAKAGVKTVVLTHFVPGDDPSIADEQWVSGVRKHFKGKVIVGTDLMEI